MVHPAVIMAGGEALSKINVPEIVHELNPVSWYERVLHELNTFRADKARIEANTQIALKDRDVEIEKIKAAERMYIAGLEQQRKHLSTANEPFFATLKAQQSAIDQTIKGCNDAVKGIISSDVGIEEKRLLIEVVKEYHKNIMEMLDKQIEVCKNKEVVLIKTLDTIKDTTLLSTKG